MSLSYNNIIDFADYINSPDTVTLTDTYNNMYANRAGNVVSDSVLPNDFYALLDALVGKSDFQGWVGQNCISDSEYASYNCQYVEGVYGKNITSPTDPNVKYSKCYVDSEATTNNKIIFDTQKAYDCGSVEQCLRSF